MLIIKKKKIHNITIAALTNNNTINFREKN